MLICGVGDKDTEDKKMGGEATINCQYYNIAAIQGPGVTGRRQWLQNVCIRGVYKTLRDRS